MRHLFSAAWADQDAVKHYVGLDREEARRLAERENREVVEAAPHFRRRRVNHVHNRVNELFDDDGVVVRADLG